MERSHERDRTLHIKGGNQLANWHEGDLEITLGTIESLKQTVVTKFKVPMIVVISPLSTISGPNQKACPGVSEE